MENRIEKLLAKFGKMDKADVSTAVIRATMKMEHRIKYYEQYPCEDNVDKLLVDWAKKHFTECLEIIDECFNI